MPPRAGPDAPTGGSLRGRRTGWRSGALYLLLSLPLGALYAALYVGLAASVVLALQGIGIPLFVVLLAVARGLGGLERHLARSLLHVDVASAVALRREPGVVRRVRRLVLDTSTWRTLAWLGARVVLAAGIAVTLLLGAAGLVATVLEPPWDAWTFLPLLWLQGFTCVSVVVALVVQVRIAAAVAPRLLGVAPEEQLAALRQASQRLADRNRLARDLHDTIGHALTASLLQATAARRTLTPAGDDAVDTGFAQQALQHIEDNTRAALDELDRALAVLRDETATALADGPDLTCLGGLLTGLRDGGLPVDLVIEVPLDDIPEEVSELGYRVVQEGTTNVLRHAGCPPTRVQVARAGGALTVSVHNAAWVPHESRPGPGGGRGLAGLRERATALGGQLVAGPTPAGGFELRATLPLPVPA